MMLGIIAGQTKVVFRFHVTPASTVLADYYYDLADAPGEFWERVRSDGGDVRVYLQNGTTKTARQVVAFDYENHVGGLFFARGGGTSFWIESGSGQAEPAANSTHGKSAVWETDAMLVAHLEDASDSTVNAQNGTWDPDEPTYATGKLQSAVDFDGAHMINFGDLGSLPSQGTISFWMRTPLQVGGYRGLSTTNKTGANSCLRLEQTGTFLYLYDGVQAKSFTTGLTTAQSLVTFTWDVVANNISTYFNGAPVASGEGHFPATIPELVIGYGFNGPPRYWDGLVDELRVYSRALAAAEVAAMYANQNAPNTFWSPS